MRSTLLPAVIALTLATPVLAADVDPLAPARTGQLQCYAPKPERKTCQALASYSIAASGIQNQAQVMLAPDPLIVLKTLTTVTVKNDAVCGLFRKEDIDSGTLLMNGQPLDAAQATAIKGQLTTALASRLGKEICTTYAPAATGFTATATIDGAPDPQGGQAMIWVGPSDGYAVGP